jgi:predicted nucleotide-binding protein
VRNKESASVRNNVVFELGLFLGKLGRRRAFWLVPRGCGKTRMSGLT